MKVALGHKVYMDKSTNELKTFCKLSNGSVQHTKTVVDHTCKLTTSHVENTCQIRQFVTHIVFFECVALLYDKINSNEVESLLFRKVIWLPQLGIEPKVPGFTYQRSNHWAIGKWGTSGSIPSWASQITFLNSSDLTSFELISSYIYALLKDN